MTEEDRFFVLAYFEYRISSALQAVLREFTLHLQALEKSLTYSYWTGSFQILFIFMISRTYFTISSYLYVCSAILAKFMGYWVSLFIIIIQMHCHCQRKSVYQEKIIRQEETIRLLEEFIDKQKEAHLQEIRVISESLQEFTKEKQLCLQQYQNSILKLGKKLDHSKEKINKQNEKLKENLTTIKTLMDKKLSLEAQILKLRDQLEKQRNKRTQQARYISELKQVVSLQQLENQQLKKEAEKLKQEIYYLQKQISQYAEIKDKFANINHISQQQYQKQINILKQSLQQEFCKNTNHIFNELNFKDTKKLREMTTQQSELNYLKSTQFIAKNNLEAQQLRRLANFVDYGQCYFQIENNQLLLPESSKIFKFISKISTLQKETIEQLQKQKQINIQISENFRQKIILFDQQIKLINEKNTQNKSTQTSQSNRIQQIINLNTNLRVKIYQITRIVTFLSEFSIFLYKILSSILTKMKYYRFSQSCLYKKQKSKGFKRFKAIALAVFSIEVLKKIGKKSKIIVETKYTRQNLEKYIGNQYLRNLIYSFTTIYKRKIAIKNHKIDEVINERSELDPGNKILSIINQENLNSGSISLNYSQNFGRFIFQVENRYK